MAGKLSNMSLQENVQECAHEVWSRRTLGLEKGHVFTPKILIDPLDSLNPRF